MMGIGVPFAVSMSTPHRQCVLQRRVTCLETVIQHDWIPAPIDDSVLHRLVVSLARPRAASTRGVTTTITGSFVPGWRSLIRATPESHFVRLGDTPSLLARWFLPRA
jgi:hypothetical protein